MQPIAPWLSNSNWLLRSLSKCLRFSVSFGVWLRCRNFDSPLPSLFCSQCAWACQCWWQPLTSDLCCGRRFGWLRSLFVRCSRSNHSFRIGFPRFRWRIYLRGWRLLLSCAPLIPFWFVPRGGFRSKSLLAASLKANSFGAHFESSIELLHRSLRQAGRRTLSSPPVGF